MPLKGGYSLFVWRLVERLLERQLPACKVNVGHNHLAIYLHCTYTTLSCLLCLLCVAATPRKLPTVPLTSLSNALEAASALCPLPRYAERCKAVTERQGALSRAFNTSAKVSELQGASETLVIRALRGRDFGFHVCRSNRGVRALILKQGQLKSITNHIT